MITFILPGLSFMGARWVWVSSHSDTASRKGVWVMMQPWTHEVLLL
jgi:hypothetical protein